MSTSELADAIQTDVPTEDQTLPTLTSPESPRMKALAAIEESNRARIEAELGVPLAADEPTDPPANADDDQLSAQLADPDPTPTPPTFKVKVNGVEQEVDQDTLIRTFQKSTAADQRLEEATRLLREAEQIAAAQAAAATPAQPTPSAAPPATADVLREEAAALLAKMYEGDQEAATEALVTLLGKVKGGDQPTPSQPAAIDPDVLTDTVLERIQVKQAFERVKTDYPDIIADPDLEFLAASKINRLVEQGVPRAQAMIDASAELYTKLGKTPMGRQPDPAPKPKSQREQNKERLDPVPTASAAAVTPPAPAEGNASAVIAELASRRLGQSLPHAT